MKNYKNLLVVVSLSLVMVFLMTACGNVFSQSAQNLSGSNSPVAGGSGSNTGGGSTTSGKTLNGCALVTKEDVKPYMQGDITQESNRGECTYQDAGFPPIILLVSVDTGDAEDFAIQKKVYGGLGGVFASATEGPLVGAGEVVGINANPQDVSGLGDETFWTGGILITRKGNTILTVTFPVGYGLSKPKLDILKELTRKALGRL